ncbi:molybdenum cofactor biosynthesis protein [Corynebacterium kutscheri]|uniref:Molybdenum cofactor biosynthesis protein n=1 Tax=Corynebacterium kutscheri TaxID=35755 RepID=A0A0F6R3D9_9CORY|nr:MogA/MoaB family molybdenum cofactor biosynthesis protein [Corynebacterium kutscheri]AKE42238.1 molybdenum cofactor synthesis domain [Corynebacterium kutscheri]VEH05699.1 molybdenum cofactor biosynthesis protein [Corynebacterium kutscheri]VEH10581.1 molybdenum cofactor biosynthesis protein [Corynebacterium kutscheri]VEH81594.1 molybdenum cofactor biosynthesis protein [Corynebacterium kutscheri]
MSYSASVITCSDRAAANIYEDRSGPILREALAELGFSVAEATIVPDDKQLISQAIHNAVTAGNRIIITTGGTGISPTDLTTEVTKELITYEIPGIMEGVRRFGSEKEPRALLSRGVAGVIQRENALTAVIINAPGSRGGARDTIAVVGPLLEHIVEQLDGVDHPMDPIEPGN